MCASTCACVCVCVQARVRECVRARMSVLWPCSICITRHVSVSVYLSVSISVAVSDSVSFSFPKTGGKQCHAICDFFGWEPVVSRICALFCCFARVCYTSSPIFLLALSTLPCTHKCMILRSYVMISESDLFCSAFLGLFCTTKETRVLGLFWHFKRD